MGCCVLRRCTITNANAKSKSGLCVSFDDALIIWAISWRWVSHVDDLKNRFEGQVLKAVNLTSKKIVRMMCEH